MRPYQLLNRFWTFREYCCLNIQVVQDQSTRRFIPEDLKLQGNSW